jgi:trk system potassium uptake protein TrkH
MIDLRPVGYIIGMLVAGMGAAMAVPMTVDLLSGHANWRAFLLAGGGGIFAGCAVALACANGRGPALTLRQSFVLTTGVWVVLPLAGALPLMLGAPDAGLTDAYFEAVSGMTTTGTTVFVGLDGLPPGINLWRCMLQWFGGLGILVVAMIFLPVMKVGGMQYFRTEGFDTLGKILPRAFDISMALLQVYVVLTLACMAVYRLLGLPAFEAVVLALSTVSTGGFSSSDQSFALFTGGPEIAASVFMILASLPFVRFVQLVQGQPLPLWQDPQVRAYLRWMAYAIAAVTAHEVIVRGVPLLPMLREATFNIVSTFSGTGFTSADLTQWGSFPFVILIIVGLIGGCTASTACSIKVFRFLILFEAIRVQLRRLNSPNAINALRYDKRLLDDDIVASVVVFFTLFMASFGLLAAALSLTGLGARAAITAAWTSIANVGPAFGAEVGPTGAVGAFPASAKWLMVVGMLVGRLELLSVYVLFMPRFWRG